MRDATGLGPEWQLIWGGDYPLETVPHRCAMVEVLDPGRSSSLRSHLAPSYGRPDFLLDASADTR